STVAMFMRAPFVLLSKRKRASVSGPTLAPSSFVLFLCFAGRRQFGLGGSELVRALGGAAQVDRLGQRRLVARQRVGVFGGDVDAARGRLHSKARKRDAEAGVARVAPGPRAHDRARDAH